MEPDSTPDTSCENFAVLGSDLVEVGKLLGKHAKTILLMSKVEIKKGLLTMMKFWRIQMLSWKASGDCYSDVGVHDQISKAPMLPMQFLMVLFDAKICLEAEDFIDYGDLFKRIMETAPMPMSPLESLSSSAVLILVLTRGGTTAKLVSKYRPSIPILSVVVPQITTDSIVWSCSDEAPARHSLIFRRLVPVLGAGSAKASDNTESTDETIEVSLQHAKAKKLCKSGDFIVALHRIDDASVIKILTVN
ncbi:hypothetical protein EZV62_013903 [Acer yangbiense]|uniref:Pyruvate kinase C-terminal domain-containing protein n=1 Tax=Acer yangbiense TaxID=1000413 RepID=A0A5C7HQN9_9ROSI|nr:hypothetical protein EZV62_013903 [Acer yangbiense]